MGKKPHQIDEHRKKGNSVTEVFSELEITHEDYLSM